MRMQQLCISKLLGAGQLERHRISPLQRFQRGQSRPKDEGRGARVRLQRWAHADLGRRPRYGHAFELQPSLKCVALRRRHDRGALFPPNVFSAPGPKASCARFAPLPPQTPRSWRTAPPPASSRSTSSSIRRAGPPIFFVCGSLPRLCPSLLLQPALGQMEQ